MKTRMGAAAGLALPDSVLRRLFRENAVRWVPGVRPAAR